MSDVAIPIEPLYSFTLSPHGKICQFTEEYILKVTVSDNSILLYRTKEDSCLYLFILCIRCVKFTEILMAIKASMILDNKPNTLARNYYLR